jgi:hypothetical protein
MVAVGVGRGVWVRVAVPVRVGVVVGVGISTVWVGVCESVGGRVKVAEAVALLDGKAVGVRVGREA